MRLAIFYPSRIFYNSGKYISESYQIYKFLTINQYFDETDLVVMLENGDVDENLFPNVVDLRGYNIHSLPFCRNGYELYITKLPHIFLSIIKLFWNYRHSWDAILLVELWPPNQLSYILCRIFRKPTILLLDGRFDVCMIYRYKRENFLKKLIGWLLSKYYKFIMKIMIKRTVTVVDSKDMFDLLKGNQKHLHRIFSTAISLCDIKKIEKIREPRIGVLNVLTVCRVHPQKGLEYLIEAINKVKESGINVKLNIVGPVDRAAYGNYEKFLRNKISQLGLLDYVKFIGPIGNRSELMKFYENADIFVLASLNEGSPKVVPEAMACGLPIIATNVGSIPDLIEDGVEGILVQPKDVDSLSGALIKLTKDIGLRRRMGEAALNKVSQFTLEVQMEKLVGIIKDTVSKGT